MESVDPRRVRMDPASGRQHPSRVELRQQLPKSAPSTVRAGRPRTRYGGRGRDRHRGHRVDERAAVLVPGASRVRHRRESAFGSIQRRASERNGDPVMSRRDIGGQRARAHRDARSDQQTLHPSSDLAGAPSRRKRGPRRTLAACALLLAGCGSATTPSAAPSTGGPAAVPTPRMTASARAAESRAGGKTATPSTPTTPSARSMAVPLGATKGIEVAVRLYSDSSLAGDASTAYRLLSARCRSRVSEEVFADRAGGSGRFSPVLTVKAEVHGNRALTSYTYPIKALDQTAEPWVREGGEWRRNRC
jgi:hypothetical protein